METNNRKLPENHFQLNQNKDLIKYSNAFNSYYYGTNPIMEDGEFDDFEQSLNLSGYADVILQEKLRIFALQGGNHIAVSLDKIKEVDKDTNIFFALQKWYLKYHINYKSIKIFEAPKFDGGALKIELNFDQSINRIITRGGKDYTEKLKQNKSIREFVDNKRKKYRVVTGELVIPIDVFIDKYSDQTENEYQLKNPRNAINSLVASDDMDVVNDLEFKPLTDGINAIQDYGNVWKELQKDDLLKLKQLCDNHRKSGYLIDGIVLAFDVAERKIVNDYPLNMVALKFKSEGVQTTVKDIEWTKKKTGRLNPVLILEPIRLDGAIIERVAAYNYSKLVDTMQCGVGSVIEIRKGDEITPKWNKTIEPAYEFCIPEDTIVNGKFLEYADNDNTVEKFILGLKKIGIDGIGPKHAQTIGECSFINYDIVELFNPEHKQKFVDKFGYNSMMNKLFTIYDIKNIQLNTVINMLQFNGCGDVLSLKFAEMLTRIKPFSDVGIDEKVFKYILVDEGKTKINDAIKRLASFRVKIIKPLQINDDVVTFEMTNNPPNGMTKKQFVEKIKERYPNCMHTSLTKNTKFLICDDVTANTGKINKARSYNIPVLTYHQVLLDGFNK